MKKVYVALLLSLLMVWGGGHANASVLTFDEFRTYEYSHVPDGYGFLNWNNLWYTNPSSWMFFPSGYANGVVSAPNVAFAGANSPGFISVASGTFDFNGAYFTAAWNDDLNIDVIGRLDGQEVYFNTISVDTDQPVWFAFNYMEIDSLELRSYGGIPHGYVGFGTHFAMDNFSYTSRVVVTPEPASVVLLGFGAVAVALRRIRRNS